MNETKTKSTIVLQESESYNFVWLAKQVDKVAEGIFKYYHISKLEVIDTEYCKVVHAVIVNEWTDERYLYTFELAGSKLKCKRVFPLGKIESNSRKDDE